MEKIGIALPGGGAKGARQAGMAAALFEAFVGAGIKPMAISGSSVGALNGLLLTQAFGDGGRSIGTMERLWRTITRSKVHSRIPKLWPWSKGIYSTKPLRRLIAESYDQEAAIASKVDFDVTATRYGPGPNPRSRPGHPDFEDVLLGAASYPVFFEPVPHGGGWLADSGISNNFPIDDLISKGCDTIIVLHCGVKGDDAMPLGGPTWIQALGAVAGEMLESQTRFQIERVNRINEQKRGGSLAAAGKRIIHLEHLFPPDEPKIGTLEFDPDKCSKAFLAAYRQTGYYGLVRRRP